jgi:UDPglucose 6-dehydrogenase
MKIAVVGSGYVGTVTGTCMAELGHEVVCADVKEDRMNKLQQGIMPFHEQGLEPLIRTNIDEGRLQFTTDIREGVRNSEVIFLCIGTPPLPNGKPDLKALTSAVKEIAASMTSYKLIVEKSTMPVKTGEWLTELLKAELPKGIEFDIAAVPQFLREGNAVRDFMHPDRIIIGAENQRAIDTLVSLYSPLNAPLLVTDVNSAELIKHASNAFLAMKISFINSIAQVCEKTGADITQVAKGLGLDKRISPEFLNAGIGYGGIFFPKDIASLLNIADEYHINLDLLKNTEVVNRYQRINFIEKIDHAVGKLEGKTVAVWGLAYRPHTDDMRDTPSINIIRGLENRGAKIRAYDPLTMPKAKEVLPDITYCNDPYEAAQGADVIAILTEWEEFAYINFRKLKEVTQCRTIVDGRNVFSPQRMATLGFEYISIGRKTIEPYKLPPQPPRDSKKADPKREKVERDLEKVLEL